MKWWKINQDPKTTFDWECFHWKDVMPGDVVQSNGTMAYRQQDFHGRNSETPCLVLAKSPILVLSRIPGTPEEPDSNQFVTFTCLSRHGIIMIVQQVGK